MPTYKDKKNGTWYVVCQYTDYKGVSKQKCKRGFGTRREAIQWETDFSLQQDASMDMKMSEFIDIYLTAMKPRLKQSSYEVKCQVIEAHIRPVFGNKAVNAVTSRDVLAWQNQLITYKDTSGKPYSKSYLKTLHNQLSCIFNYAVNNYDLQSNPARKAGNMGSEDEVKISFWTKEEYEKFSYQAMDDPIAYYAFEVLYWTGIREGELLALTPSDFDFTANTLSITKTYHRIHGEDVVTKPKTKKSVRTVSLPEFLVKEIQEYISQQYSISPADRLFPVSKEYLLFRMKKYSKAAGVKSIRIHDLRHSHISLLINMGFTPLAIAERVGHEAIEITYRYSHLFPSVQKEMVDKLQAQKGSI
ncbi:MAG: site-specific integrase [Oscillospiraceae bacterium]|nr:site-specific integrase [Oscillospiraceae bacterium]